MQPSKDSQWMLVRNDILKDAPFFIPLGILFGGIQIISYRYFEKSNFGSELLQEHIPYNSLVLTVIFILLIKGLTEWLKPKKKLVLIEALVNHIAERAVAFASVAASIVLGFCITAAWSGAYFHALMFLLFSIYLVALAEIAANPLVGQGKSKIHSAALGVIVGLTLGIKLIA